MENNIPNQEQPVDNRIDKKEEEIDLVEIVQKLWRNRKFIIKVTIVFAILGFIVAISTPNIYTASCTMVPQTGQKSTGGSLGGLAAMAGINLGSISSGEVFSPTIYPKIMTNINFQKELIYSKFHFQGVEQPITLYDHYTDKKYQKFSLTGVIRQYTIGLPNIIIRAINGVVRGKDTNNTQSESASIYSVTSKERQVINITKNILRLDINNKDGFITLSANMDEPVLAVEMVQTGFSLLQKYITDFKLEKVANNLEFIERSYNEAKINFETKQEELAMFRDANKSFSSAVAKTQEEKLISEYNLLLGIYTELAKQKEQAKIAITETTPILTIIEPVVMPIGKAKTDRYMLIFFYTFLGIFVGVVTVFVVSYLESNFSTRIKGHRFFPKII